MPAAGLDIRAGAYRANAVKNALTQKGIDPGRVAAAGMGGCCPVSSDNAANRRVSMLLTGQA